MVAGAAGRILTTELTSSCRRFSGAIPDRWRFPFSHEYSRSISSRERSLSVCRSDKRRRRRRGTVVAQACRRRGLLFGQAIDEVVHDEIDHVDVLARAVIEMVATDGEAVAVAAKQKDMEIGSGQADAGGERDGAAVNEVGAVAVDEIGKTRRATDPGESDDLFVIELAFLEDFVKGS